MRKEPPPIRAKESAADADPFSELSFLSMGSLMNRSTLGLAAISLVLGLSGCASSGDVGSANSSRQAAVMKEPAPTVSMIAPLIEKRDTLIGTGYAVISVQNHRVPAQQRLLAIRASKLDAYRSLTEQVYGQYLDSTSTVADMAVLSETFRAKVEGVVYGAVLVSITPIGDDTYETTLSLDREVVNDLRLLYLGQLASRQQR